MQKITPLQLKLTHESFNQCTWHLFEFYSTFKIKKLKMLNMSEAFMLWCNQKNNKFHYFSHNNVVYFMTAGTQSVKPLIIIIIHSQVWLNSRCFTIKQYHAQGTTWNRQVAKKKAAAAGGSARVCRRTAAAAAAAVCRRYQILATFHICIQIQNLQMAIEPSLNQYVICWLGEASYTS